MPTPRPRFENGAPPLPLLLLEPQRALAESVITRVLAPLVHRAPRGDGHPVLVLPGFTAGDRSTRFLRRTLRKLDFEAHPWLLGQNLGERDGLRGKLAERVEELADRHGSEISIVGWSLGGIYAREIAKLAPKHVRQVVTLGSPFGDIRRGSRASRLYDLVNRSAAPDAAATRRQRAFADEIRTPPPVPSSAIYTKTDGVVHWKTCREAEGAYTENIEVPGSHCGLGANALAILAIADRLSQPKGEWQPFERSGWRRLAYG